MALYACYVRLTTLGSVLRNVRSYSRMQDRGWIELPERRYRWYSIVFCTAILSSVQVIISRITTVVLETSDGWGSKCLFWEHTCEPVSALTGPSGLELEPSRDVGGRVTVVTSGWGTYS